MATEIALIFSTGGPYAALGQSALDGARMALDEIAAAGGPPLGAVIRDPMGKPEAYASMAEALLAEGRVRHVVGAITSRSRKHMLPVLERHDGLLWYPTPYEGFERSENVVYLGAAPNQHLLPLLDQVDEHGLRRAFLVGPDSVWGREMLRLARAHLDSLGAEVLGAHLVPPGTSASAPLTEAVLAAGPDVVVNALVGPASAAFLRALAARSNRDKPAMPRIVGCHQTEADLAALGPAADGLLAVGAWFETVPGEANAAFRARIRAAYGSGYRASCVFATAYLAVRLLAGSITASGCNDPRRVFEALTARSFDTVLGRIAIDPVSRHTALTPHLARVRGAEFEILHAATAPVPADPYLTGLEALARNPVRLGPPRLRVRP